VSSQAPKAVDDSSPQSGHFSVQVAKSLRPSSVPGPTTYEASCAHGLEGLCHALGRQDQLETYRDLARFLLQKWGDAQVPENAPYASNIGDDHSPFEYSLAFDPAGVELRLLFEAQANPPSAANNQRAALSLNRQLAERYAVNMRRFDLIQDLFLGAPATGSFSLWHAVSLNPGRAPAFKLYLNPQTQGVQQALPVVEEAFRRLGFSDEAMDCVRRALPRSGLDELSYFSLDLSDKPEARVKVYVAHPHISAQDMDAVFSVCPQHRAGDVIDYCESMLNAHGPFTEKPLMSCLSFVSGRERPATMTLHLPIAHYVESDQVTADRVTKFLRRHGLDHAAYRRALAAVARRPLADGTGIQSYASYRREKAGLRLTTYLSPELFRP
jgi:DMATS type aromatic prenyltransferase